MADDARYPIPDTARDETRCSAADYDRMYQRSIEDPEGFWAEHGRRLDWIKPFATIKNARFDGDVAIKWFEDGTLNACVQCVDRHLPAKANDSAIIWEGDNPAYHHSITYGQLYRHVCRMANVLKHLGVKKGDRVTIYMPMIPEVAYAMLACARIGAVHSVVFGGFSPEALAGRIEDCGSTFVITADQGVRGGKAVPLKKNVDKALEHAQGVKDVLIVRHTGADIDWFEERDHWYHELSLLVPSDCEPEEMNAEDPLFILYTSGSTGSPKGVLHSTGGYMVWASMTHEYVFDYRPGEVYWCTADVGWVTGHSYIVYGPLANGATTLMFEGVPTYPGVDRMWRIVNKHNVNILYTAPTAIRALMREGDEPVTKHDRSSLRLLGSVGEPINPEAWSWFHEVVGEGRCPIVDTWWQTETGGIMITPLPGATELKPGSATRPFFGVEPALVDNEGHLVEDLVGEGNLVIRDSWPGQARTVFGDHERFQQTYFSAFPGYYFTGDGAKRDADGYYWITGRVDDVLNVSGHRLGTAEIESALVAHRLVSEAAVVGYPHEMKGQGIYCYVTLNAGLEPTEDLGRELRAWVRQEIGPVATPDLFHFTPALPKTRSGKIMRRILRKIAENEFSNLGDTSTLADPGVVDDLIEGRLNR
ncbi:acetate--CoA ligase [Rhodothalassium salexigens]|uniref:acetate--CoA ligase n=1 Tax=Rhodothalassium salexigens TaxID=1086 RepID=UPI001914AA49|nr:acetate--CoA ligase [Rhodothalassium salexigens]MBK5909921.1 acetate--CoA ligase [Rhodothalassium salexigens]MBK5921998.1 acetate--CoA ligase [Rhodothalassium salexigens]